MRIGIHYEDMYGRYGLYICDEERAVLPVKWKDVKRHEPMKPALAIDSKTELQELMDDLWRIGLRPSERADEYKAQLGSMRDHLNDMRTLVFKKREDLLK